MLYIKALSYNTFAKGPYNKYSTQTFSNALEGFDPETEKTCSISDSQYSLGAYTTCDYSTAPELHVNYIIIIVVFTLFHASLYNYRYYSWNWFLHYF